jgi:hypothetical protein
MLAFLQLLGTFVGNLFRSRRQLEIENLFLWHQLNIFTHAASYPSAPAIKAWMPPNERKSLLPAKHDFSGMH